MHRKSIYSFFFLAIVVSIRAYGQTTNPSSSKSIPVIPAEEDVSITVTATALPMPALRYRLIPSISQQTPGNAATQYMMALANFNQWTDFQPMETQLSIPVEKLNKEQAAQAVRSYGDRIHNIALAAYREECFWDLPFRQEGLNVELTFLNPMRFAATAVALQAKLDIANGETRNAIDHLQIGFAMVNHLRNQAGLVQALVANGIAEQFLNEVAEFQRQNDAPNLYWALADLPMPLIDVHAALAMEQAILESNYPELKGRNITDLDDDDLRIVLNEIKASYLWDWRLHHSRGQGDGEFEFAKMMAGDFVPASQYLLDQGRTDEQVNQMPVESVLAIYLVDQYRELEEGVNKWTSLPYWQSCEPIAQASHEIIFQVNEGKGPQRVSPGSPIDEIMRQTTAGDNPLIVNLGDISKAFSRFAQVQRLLAQLQCVEALRAYAASHNHKFPTSLNDLIDTPAPLDPITGKEFDYESTGDTAILGLRGFLIPTASTPLPVQGEVIRISLNPGNPRGESR